MPFSAKLTAPDFDLKRRTERYRLRSRVGERSEHLRSGLPDVAQAFRQDLHIAVPQLDIVGGSRAGFEANGLADDKRRGLGLGLADQLRRAGPAVAAVKKLVRQLMRERREFLGRRLAGQKGNPATRGHPAGWRDFRGVSDGDALRGCKPAQPFAVLAGIARDRTNLRQFLPFGLADVEHVVARKPAIWRDAFSLPS